MVSDPPSRKAPARQASDWWSFAVVVCGRGHAADDLPRAARANPCVGDPQSVSSNFDACAVGPRCINSIVVDRDIAYYLNCELLDRVGVKGNAFGRVRSDPVGDVILSHGSGTDKWPADKIRVPQRPILLQVVGLHIRPVRFF